MNNHDRSQPAPQAAGAGPASRRHFLQLAATAAAFTIVPRHVLGGAGQVAPNSKTTLAGIGLGGQGMQNLAALAEFPEVQVLAVCDVNREGGGYLSWNWSQGTEHRSCGREGVNKC